MKIKTFYHRWAKDAGFQKYLKNSSWLISTKILTLSLAFIATAFTARFFGPSNFGQISYAVSIIGIFGFFSTLGIDSMVYRDLLSTPEKKSSIMGTAFILRFIGGALTTLLIILYCLFFENDDTSRILIYLISGTFIINSFQIIYYESQSRTDSKSTSLVTITASVIMNLIKIFIAIFHINIFWLGATFLIESIIYASGYIIIYKINSDIKINDWTFDKTYSISLLKQSLPMIIQGAFTVVYSRVDQVIIKNLLDTSAVGKYDSAVRIAELWTILPYLLITALYPAIINAKKVSVQLYAKRFLYLGLLLFVIAVAVASVITLIAPIIIKVLYGSEFIEAIPVLKIYVWSFVGTSLGVFITQYLITENLQKIIAYIMILPMIVNIILNILWIPIYGINGAAYATLISYSLTPLMIILFRRPRQDFSLVTKQFFPKLYKLTNIKS